MTALASLADLERRIEALEGQVEAAAGDSLSPPGIFAINPDGTISRAVQAPATVFSIQQTSDDSAHNGAFLIIDENSRAWVMARKVTGQARDFRVIGNLPAEPAIFSLIGTSDNNYADLTFDGTNFDHDSTGGLNLRCVGPGAGDIRTWGINGINPMFRVGSENFTGSIDISHDGTDGKIENSNVSGAIRMRGVANNARAISAATTLAAGDFAACDGSGGGYTVTLPSASGAELGDVIVIKKTDANSDPGHAITVAGVGIPGVTPSLVLQQSLSALVVQTDRANWHAIAEYATATAI